MYWLLGLCILFGVLATAEDLWRRKVSNPIALAALVSGIAAQSILYGLQGTWNSLLGTVIGFVVFLVFFLVGGMGGGDVKLMAGFGAIIGWQRMFIAAFLVAIVGAVMALVFVAARLVMRKLRSKGEGAEVSPLKSSIPYAPAITAGVLMSFLIPEGELWTNV